MVISLRLTGDPAEIPGALDALESWLGATGLSAEELGEWRLLAEEVLTNIVHHGSPPQCEEAICIDGLYGSNGVELRVEDRGTPFDPCAAAPPDLSAPPEERCGGGLGVHLMRTLADEMDYAHRDGRNILTLRKRSLSASCGQGQAQPEARPDNHL